MQMFPRRIRLALCASSLTILLILHIYRQWHRNSRKEDSTARNIVSKPSSLIFGLKNNVTTASSGKIPCIIHQSWKTNQLPSNRAHRWRDTWLKCMPTCKHVFWTDEDNKRLIEAHYQWLLPVYEHLTSGVQRADLARYVYMLHHGGIYADLDTVCLRDFSHLLMPYSLVFGGMDGHWIRSVNGSYVQNSFMASERGHPFWLGLLHRIAIRHRKKVSGGAEESTGPLILMDELKKYVDEKLGDVKIFPPEMFNPFSWITNKKKECKTHGGMSDEEEAACVATFPNAFVVQLHCKSWGGGKA